VEPGAYRARARALRRATPRPPDAAAEACLLASQGDRINGLVDGVTGDWYCKFDTFHPAVDNGLPVTRVISRVTLQGILAGGLPESCILNNCKVASYEEDSDGITAVLEDGRRFKGDVLIGADGACPQRARAWRVR
jgi:2-polyprenyl-6-methoxyphenol hydroxylase-like FAD-dependent oxidoreductase